MMRVLVDSDVVIAAMAGNEDQSASSTVVMNALSAGAFTGLTTPILLANIMYILGNKWRVSRKYQDRPRVARAMNSLLPMFTLLPVNMADFYASLASEFADLEDAVQHSAAVHAGNVDAILTCNVKDYRTASLPVMEPGAFASQYLT